LNSENQEICVTILAGNADVTTRRESWEGIGDRKSVFDSKAPFAVYAPPDELITLTAPSSLEIGVARAPATGKFQARLIRPEDCTLESRGTGTNTRHICNVLFGNVEAESLLVVEVITPAGNWSSYPPHKHDTDRVPVETHLEETYYHRLNPPQGFAFQRVYTDDRDLDESMSVEDGDVVMVPKGYHPVGTPHGYDLYYLNTMAGPKREWIFHNDPEHEWILERDSDG
jgi:5-deoxy-glucuronate isomerase